MKRNEDADEARRTTPPAEDRQDPRPGRGPDSGAAERGRSGSDVPEAPRDVPPQEPPD
ncbi:MULTISPECIES: hypothetical protein [unclassified Streptomyces]|uniref:hypothetical protein n=1 Tax=unclassified Streptomyces TaxID=2593676 RepID=UPI0003A4BED7|nr:MULTISPECIES: hypothetical protein [unclassified Streptomyces]MYX34778.1 hypothetical protein [Streptomyces sp. SID8377]